MVKRQSRERAKDRKASEDLSDDERKKKRSCRKKSEDVVWVIDTTLNNEDDDDSSYASDDEPTGSEYEEFLSELLKKYSKIEEPEEIPRSKKKKVKNVQPAMDLSRSEMTYFNKLPRDKQQELNKHMLRMKEYNSYESEIPLKFRVLALPISEYIKTNVLKKITSLEDDSGESHKLKNWIDAFFRIPFGKQIPLPVSLSHGKPKCSEFMRESKNTLDKAVYGMPAAKTQIMQVLAQWIANPDAVGNVIALQGPPGVGKTSIARNGIAKALHRPFEFFSLGGASDISTFVGHSYTYEGSLWGRVTDSLMNAKCMNPILYFDELDKISSTPHGEEIASMLIHLTDRSQNSQFHDRYFAGIDFDLSQCLFVFSFNDITSINPILKDRMQVIQCAGYSEKEKQVILEKYVWPDILKRLKFEEADIMLTDDASKFMIKEYSSKEEGVRTLIRTSETIITRLNMLRIADEETMKDYKFYTEVSFPIKLNETIIRKLLVDIAVKEAETWKSMYN